MNEDALFDVETPFAGFDRLMPHRVREILLVSSPYDSFIIAEDERLTELVFGEYLDLNLRYAPRLTRVSTAAEAFERIEKGRFDAVLTMMRIGTLDIPSFAGRVKSSAPDLPVVLLGANPLDVVQLSPAERKALDGVFLWRGDPRIILSIIKLIEDRANVDPDMEAAGVQAILLVEDSVRFYSSYLPLIYTELMKQTQRLIPEGVNLTHKMMRIRARPKLLLATTFEEAWELYDKYRERLMCLIVDRQFPRGGRQDPEAGLAFSTRVKEDAWDTPILVQSSDGSVEPKARELGASFLNKRSPTLLHDLRRFLLEHVGFGDFVFHLPGGRVIARASDLRSMIKVLRSVPLESLAYHASRNHFSKWLMTRTEFEFASQLRPRKGADFEEPEGLRRFLMTTFARILRRSQAGVVTDFSSRSFSEATPFVKIGGGSLGGKGRGLAFLNALLNRGDAARRFPDVRIGIPNTTVVATDAFDAFMDRGRVRAVVGEASDDREVKAAFDAARLPGRIRHDLLGFVRRVRYPLAVRSSSLLEDSQTQPFAGVYDTYMLPNNHPDEDVRMEQLCRAVRLVYASAFSLKARAYLRATPHLQDEEKMAVIIQKLVGRSYGERFYPTVSGVAQSRNFYPVAPLKGADGIAYVALGLGMTVMEGRRSLWFSPRHPQHLHQFSSVKDTLANSQREFMALNLRHPGLETSDTPEATILELGLSEAEADGTLELLGSTYDHADDRIHDGVARRGARLVTFSHVLKSDAFPLAGILEYLLEVGERSIGGPVELEFASDPARRTFELVQMRPMAAWSTARSVKFDDFEDARVLCRCARSLGHGRRSDVADVVYVRRAGFDRSKTREIAGEIGRLNEALQKSGRGYLLIGPGRWGTADPSLGIPVGWAQISGTRAIVETTFEDLCVDPSFGTHFLHNVISLGIGYFTMHDEPNEDRIDWNWLDGLPAAAETNCVRHVRLKDPLDIRIDGASGAGVVLKPSPRGPA